MKNSLLIAFVVVLVWFSVAATFGPVGLFQNSWSTNRPPRAVEGVDNLQVTNRGSGTGWLFYAVGPNTVARLSDATNISKANTNFNEIVVTNQIDLSGSGAYLSSNILVFRTDGGSTSFDIQGQPDTVNFSFSSDGSMGIDGGFSCETLHVNNLNAFENFFITSGSGDYGVGPLPTYSPTNFLNLQSATNQFGNTNRFIASDSGLGTNNVLYNANHASDQLASDTSTKTNYFEAGAAYPGATSVNNGGQLRFNGGLGPARIAITNWNRFTNSICTNVISTVDGIFTLYATNGACAGCWTNGASLVTCATNLATNINNALFFGSTLRISNYVTVSANGSNVFFQPLAKTEMMTVGSVTNGATNLNATVNAILLQPVSGNVGIGTNAPAQALEVQGNLNASGNITNSGNIKTASGIVLSANQISLGSLSGTYFLSTPGGPSIGGISANSIKFSDGNGGEWARFTNGGAGAVNGTFGIGTNSPFATLHIRNIGTNAIARFDSGIATIADIKTNNSQFYTPILAPTNAALVTTVAPANLHNIAIGKGWTNDLGARADLVISVKYVDAATGDPKLAFTNTATGEAFTNTFAFALNATIQETVVIPDLSTNDYGSFTDLSGTGASVTFLNAWWKLK